MLASVSGGTCFSGFQQDSGEWLGRLYTLKGPETFAIGPGTDSVWKLLFGNGIQKGNIFVYGVLRTLKRQPELGQWSMSVISALGRLRQEDCEFEASLGNTVRPCLRKKEDDVVLSGGTPVCGRWACAVFQYALLDLSFR